MPARQQVETRCGDAAVIKPLNVLKGTSHYSLSCHSLA